MLLLPCRASWEYLSAPSSAQARYCRAYFRASICLWSSLPLFFSFPMYPSHRRLASALLPGAIVTGQLNRFMPVDGSIYVWTHKALGPLWGFFAGFCAWFPVILAMLAGCDTVLSLVQGTGIQLFGAGTGWFAAPWEQGIFVVVILIITGWIATLPLRLIMRIAKVVIPLYGLGIFVVGLAGVA